MNTAKIFSVIGVSKDKNESNKLSKKASGPPRILTAVLDKHSIPEKKQYSKP
jgi:hypothetical protein